MRVVLSSVLSLALSGPAETPTPARQDAAAPDASATIESETETEAATELDPERIAQGEALWGAGRYSEARKLLEPLAEAGPIKDRLVREKLLTVLADATINDPELPEDERREMAASHLNRLMDRDASWRMPPNIFSFELFSLYLDLRMERAEKAGEACSANLIACESSVDNAESKIRQEKAAYRKLKADYEAQEVEVRDRVARSRIFAALPFGIGHFYNGDKALGASFLGAEAAFGIAGLSLLIYRTVADRCTRTNGFQEGSLECAPRDPRTTRDQIAARRVAEETMAWLFLGTIALDIIIAQIRFRPYETLSVRRVKRRDLEEGDAESPDGPPKKPSKRSRGKPRAKVRTSPVASPQGVGVLIDVRF